MRWFEGGARLLGAGGDAFTGESTDARLAMQTTWLQCLEEFRTGRLFRGLNASNAALSGQNKKDGRFVAMLLQVRGQTLCT
jgi:hypothetical protein